MLTPFAGSVEWFLSGGMTPLQSEDRMKTETFKAEAGSGRGKTFDTPLPYSGEYLVYETAEEIKAANDWPSDGDIVEYRNTQRKLAARNKALNQALDDAGIEKQTIENSETLRLSGMVKILVASGMTEDEATNVAKTTLNIS